MRLKKPTVRNKGTPYEAIQCSSSECMWHRNPIKKWLYIYIINDLNKIIWRYFQREIEL
jgi:hypothetical protein